VFLQTVVSCGFSSRGLSLLTAVVTPCGKGLVNVDADPGLACDATGLGRTRPVLQEVFAGDVSGVLTSGVVSVVDIKEL